MENKIIGGKIAEARKKNNISQAQLAQRLFISSQAVGKWERGESFPDIITFNRLAKIFGVDLNYFSDDFRSVATETETSENLLTQPTELPPANQKKKLNWDMSDGNWVDADFSGLKNLKDKFSSSNMKNCRFFGSELSGLLLKNNNIDSCDFSGSDISKSRIQSSNLVRNMFKDCSLKETGFSGSNINGCDFSGTSFNGAEFLKNNNVEGCTFTGSDFGSSHFQSSNIANNQFKDCSLQEAEFSESSISGCDFSDADFTGAVFKSGGIQNNLMPNALWNSTTFNAMHIADIVFDGTIEDCYFENCAFKRVTFRNSKLINTFFKNKNLKGIQFINCQADRMTYEFLKNGKADLSGITQLT